MFQTIFGVVVFAATLLLIVTRPFKLNEAMIALGGAFLMLVGGVVSPGAAVEVLEGKLDVFFFFLGLMTIAAVAENAGFFDWAASLAGLLARGSGRRLLFNIFLLGVLISTFFSNDATALILTPVVYSLVIRLRLNPLPFMFACTFIADTASYVLPVSNPINILVLGQFPANLPHFLGRLILPSLFCIAVNIGFFFWLFRGDLPRQFDLTRLDQPASQIKHPLYFRYASTCLLLVALGYVFASAFRLPLSLVAMTWAILLAGGAFALRQLTLRSLLSQISWSLFGFIGGMFIVVQGMENIGVTGELGRLLVSAAGDNLFIAVLVIVTGTAIGANLINNVPMTLVMLSALSQQVAGLNYQLKDGMVYGVIFGADLGPNLTTIGSLATVLWLVILRRKGLEISSFQYFKIGIAVTPLMLLAGSVAIWLSLLLF